MHEHIFSVLLSGLSPICGVAVSALPAPCRGGRVRRKLELKPEVLRGAKECLSWEWAGGCEEGLWGCLVELLGVSWSWLFIIFGSLFL